MRRGAFLVEVVCVCFELFFCLLPLEPLGALRLLRPPCLLPSRWDAMTPSLRTPHRCDADAPRVITAPEFRPNAFEVS